MITAFRLTALTLMSSAFAFACSSADPEAAEPVAAAGAAGASAGGVAGASAAGAGGAAGVAGAPGQGGAAGTSAAGGSGGSTAAGAGGSGVGGDGSGVGGSTTLAHYPDAGFEYEASDAGPATCAAVTGQATLHKRPMDIIISIDNSGSMAGEIQAVQQRVNDDFAAIIANSGINYRVIMVSRYGNVYSENTSLPYDGAFGVCIGDDLGNDAACPASAGAATPALANNPPLFFHDSINIGSGNMLCQVINSYSLTTASAPHGWQEWLRPEAFKVFIGITDDSPRPNASGNQGQCATSSGLTDSLAGAQQFDSLLRGLSLEQFGTADNRNYAWYSIVGMAGNSTTAPTPLGPNDPIETQCCRGDGTSRLCPGGTPPDADGVRAGTAYQELSRMTGGLRYPSCFNSNFDAMFNAVAEGVIERSSASCEYALPVPEHGTINPANIVATYHPSAGGADVALSRVATANDCGSGQGFYLDDNTNPTHLSLCSSACSLVQADDAARIDIDFGCLGS